MAFHFESGQEVFLGLFSLPGLPKSGGIRPSVTLLYQMWRAVMYISFRDKHVLVNPTRAM